MGTTVQDAFGLTNETKRQDEKYVLQAFPWIDETLLNCFFLHLLCADPSPRKIPSLEPYIATAVQGSVFSAKTQRLTGEKVTD